MQVGFYFNQNRCIGCGTCQVACKDWHDIPAGPINWMNINYIEIGNYPDIFVSYMASPCYHCEEPNCLEACPTDAIYKRSDNGLVLVNSQACIGNEECNSKCLKACPYGAPQFGPEKGAKMSKCNFCLDRWEINQLPVCVEACPTRALDAGPLEELRSRYGDLQEAEGFLYSKKTKPSIIIKQKSC